MDSVSAAHAREPRNIRNVLELVGVGLLDCKRRLAGLSGKGAEQRGSENRQLVYACVDDTSANRLVNHKRAANRRPRKPAVARAGINSGKVHFFSERRRPSSCSIRTSRQHVRTAPALLPGA